MAITVKLIQLSLIIKPLADSCRMNSLNVLLAIANCKGPVVQ